MDNNSSLPQTSNTTTVMPEQPAKTPASVPQVALTASGDGGGSKKIFLFLIVGFMVALLGAGGIYYYLSLSQAPKITQSTATSQNSTPASSAVAGVTSVESELNAINVNSLNGAMDELDKDINKL